MHDNNPAQTAINEVLTLLAVGRVADMEVRARTYLRSFPGNAVLSELLGMAIAAQYRHAEALAYLRSAVRIDAADPQFWENLGLCQRQLRQLSDAEASLRQALVLRPGWPATLDALAEVLHALGRHTEAQATTKELAAIDRHFRQRERFQREQWLRSAVAADPAKAALHDELGLVLSMNGDLAGAESCFRRAIACDPANARSHVNLAVLLKQRDRAMESVAAARVALDLLGKPTPAMSPDKLELVVHATLLLEGAGENTEAARTCAEVYKISGNLSLALPAVYAARKACDWALASALEQEACQSARAYLDSRMAAPPALLCLPRATPLDQLAAARSFAAQIVPAIPAQPRRLHPRPSGRRVRVSYFSRDFYAHATSVLLTGVIESHDRQHFEIIAHDYSRAADDDYRRRLAAAFERMIPLRDLPDAAAAQRIANDEVDILIDINGWIVGNRAQVIAARPAAVQMQWLGYPGTSGAPWIDYVIGDPVLIPHGHEPHFSEKIIRMPHSYQPNDDKRAIGEARPRHTYGLPDDALVFCCFNQAFKIGPEVFDIWMRLLKTTEHSVLWLLDPGAQTRDALMREAAARGVEPARLIFAPRTTPPEHLARVTRADLALDCFPYGSHTTASDMLWAGVPLIALQGETFASRVSASVLTAAGLPRLIAHSLDQYEELASRLARERGELAELRTQLAETRGSCALFDTRAFTRNLESAYMAAWTRHQQGLAPDHIDV